MNTRDQFIQEFRGIINGISINQSTPEESFQNEILRPILKLQNEIICSFFEHYLKLNKIDFNNFSSDKKIKTIDNAVFKDPKFRNTIKGIVISLFTIPELEIYTNNSSNLNKRMMSMLVERLKSQFIIIDKSNI